MSVFHSDRHSGLFWEVLQYRPHFRKKYDSTVLNTNIKEIILKMDKKGFIGKAES